MNKKIVIGVIALVALLFFLGCTSTADTKENNVALSETENQITIPLNGITSQAQFFEYDSDGTKIKFFALKASDGSIKTAFDACDVCYSAKKGYRQEGDYMICNNCGNKYAIASLGTENKKGGGCWPGYLPSEVSGNNIVINKTDLEIGKYRFV